MTAGDEPFHADGDRDILTVLRVMAQGFEGLGMKPPAVLLLADNREGMRLMCEVQARNFMQYVPGDFGKPIEHPDGSVWMEITLFEIKVRWPAIQYAAPTGGYVWQ